MSTFTLRLRTAFTRHRLLLARLGWVAVCLLILSMIAANIPYLYRDTSNEWQVGEAVAAALRLFPTRNAFLYTLITLRLITLAFFTFTALFLAWRMWDDWFVLYVSATLLMMGYFFGTRFDIDLIRYPHWLWQTFPAIRAIAPSLIVINMVLFFYLFPDGRFSPRWLIWFTIPAILFILGLMGELFRFSIVIDNLLEWLLPANTDWWVVFTTTLIVTILLGLVAQLARYWQTPAGAARQQIKWVLFGLASIPIIPLLESLLANLLQIDESTQHLLALFMGIILPLAIPITIAFSVLRYRLWEVDVWINRTVVYGGLTAVILTLYGLSVGLLSSLIPNNSSLFIPFIALIAAALTAIPAHRSLQRLANRWLPPPSKRSEIPPLPRSPAPPLPFRLAHLLWLTLCLFLIWQFALVLGNMQAILAFQRTEWSVQESLKALPGVTAAGYVLYLTVLRLVTAVFYWLTAVLIFWRKRDDWFALAVSFLLLFLPFSMVLADINSEPLEALGLLALLSILLLPFVFPDGRLIPQSTRWRIFLIAYLMLTPLLTFTLLPLIFPHFRSDDVAWVGLIVSLTLVLAAGMVSQIVRYRQLLAAEQQQIKWVLIGGFGSFMLFFFGTSIWVLAELADPFSVLIVNHLNIFSSAIFPLTIGYSVLRHRLWGVDVLVNRTLVFGGLTLLVTAVYILTVGLLSNLFQNGSSLTLSILATGLIAIFFNPLRQRLQTAVNRLMYGERDDPITMLTTLGRRLSETAVPTQILPTLVETIAQTLKFPYVAIKSNEGGEEILAAYPTQYAVRHTLHTFPLIYQSETIGQLLVSPRAPGETFNPAEQRLLENVARQAGTAVYAAQLTHHLQRSRERLVTTREEERRRLRRDLHDGLGPQMATLTIKVGAAQNLLRTDPDGANDLLDQVKAESQKAIKEIRRVVNDLRPSVLDQLGLLSALHEFVTQNQAGGTQITLHTPDVLPPLPAAVEVAAYRIVTEAITNTVRHAQARVCTIHLEIAETMNLTINDDGIGLAGNYQSGVGLSSMRERAVEIGGSFEIQSKPGQGTRLAVRLPIAGDQ